MKIPLLEPNSVPCRALRTEKRTGLSKCLLTLVGATALSFQAFAADTDVGLSFNGDGGNDTQAGTITVNITADTVTLTGTAGAQTVALNPPSRDAFPSYVGGSFTIGFEALGTVADNFDPNDFTGGLADGVYSGSVQWAVNSDINNQVNTILGQGLVFTFDFTNLTGANGVNLSAIRMNNDLDGARVRYLEDGTSASSPVYSGGGAVGGNVTQFVTQPLGTGDKISFHTADTGNPAGNGQVRLYELFFDFIPTTILQPTLTASVGTSQTVVLDWDDDLSGVATSYEVYRSTTSGSYGAPIATLTGGTFASEYTDTGLTNATTYYYQVVATDGVSPATSNEVEATPYATVAGSSVYVHYDASNAANVTVVNTNEVTALADIANTFNADVGGPAPGTVLYPSATFPTGLVGLDMGSTRNTIRTLLPPEQPDLLDFTSAANALPYSGFAFFVVVKVDSILSGNVNAILGNHGLPEQGSLMLRLDGAGNSPRLLIGNQDSAAGNVDATSTTIANAGASIVAGDTVVIAANYDKLTGELEFWNSKAGTSVTGTVPAADFSNTTFQASALFIGGTNITGQFMDGAIGEVKFYQGKRTPEEFAIEQNLLVTKWIGVPEPTGLVATEGNGQIELDWDDQVADSYTVYRSLTEVGGYSAVSGALTSSDFIDNTVTNGTTYYYYVTATVDASEGDPSATVSATPFTPITGNTLYAHYDATDAGSVSFATANEVSVWADQTANAFDATAAGSGDPIIYPSVAPLLSSTGLAGLNTRGTTDSKLLTFSPAEQNEWLNFSSASNGAKEYGGFVVLAVVRPIAIGSGTNDVVFSNHGNVVAEENSFALRYFEGRPQVLAATQLISRDPIIESGETVVLAVNYNSETGNMEFWDSESGDSVTTAIAGTNFSSTQNMYIAGSLNNGQGMNGIYCELKVYRGTMTPAEFAAEREALMSKWVQKAPVNVTAEGAVSDITINWVDPNPTVSDTYSVYRTTTQGDYGVTPTPLVSGLTSTSYVDSTVSLGTTYYYVVTATRDGNESDFSDEVFEAPYPATTLYAHYDPSNAANVTVAGSKVTDLADLSGNGYGAEDGDGTEFGDVFYPDATPSPAGLDLLDMGATRNTLRTLVPGEQDALLDFTGAASANSGFSFFVVTRVDSLLAGIIRDVVLANRGDITDGLVLRLQGGAPELYLDGVKAELASPAPVAGDTLVIAANYNKETQQLELWNSKADASVTVTVPAGDFSEATAIFIGGSNNEGQYMDGAIGEVKFYQGRLSAAAFAAEQLALTEKWITGSPGFSSWITQDFANGPVTNQGPNDDDDNDGISNLVEYAIAGQDPTVGNPTISTFDGTTLSFSKRLDASGLTYAIQDSTDLGVTDAWAEVTAGPPDYVNDAGTISYKLTPGTPAKNFIRLQVLSN